MPGIEGFGSLFNRNEYHRDPELGPKEIDAIFVSQGNRGEPRLLNPIPKNLANLAQLDPDTFGKLLAASYITSYFYEKTDLNGIALTGGLAVDTWVGDIARHHHDVDLLVPYRYLNTVKRCFDDAMDESWYTVVLFNPIGLFQSKDFQDFLTQNKIHLPKEFFHWKYTIDLFPYDENGVAYDKFGGKEHLSLLSSEYPLKTVSRLVYGRPVEVAPLHVIKSLKSKDNRRVGLFDQNRLNLLISAK